jgi:hypothetical protein
MLVRRAVLEKLTPPHFRAGQYHPGRVNEDLYFVDSIKRAGTLIPVDLGVTLGHLNNVEARPTLHQGAWHVELQVNGKHIVRWKA